MATAIIHARPQVVEREYHLALDLKTGYMTVESNPSIVGEEIVFAPSAVEALVTEYLKAFPRK